MTETSRALRDADFLRAILNLAIPAEGRMPGAGDLGLWANVEAALAKNPTALAAVAAGLDAVRAAALQRDPGGLAALTTAAALDVVTSGTHPALMPTLARTAAFAYYQQPAVLEALGEPARPPFPDGFELEGISAGMLALLEKRKIG